MQKHILTLAGITLSLALGACAGQRDKNVYDESSRRTADGSSSAATRDSAARDSATRDSAERTEPVADGSMRNESATRDEAFSDAAPGSGSRSLAGDANAADGRLDNNLGGSLANDSSAIDSSGLDGMNATGGALGSGTAAGEAARAAEVANAPSMADLVQHHQDGVALARIGEQRGSNAEVKRIAAEVRGTEERVLAMKQKKAAMKGASATASETAASETATPEARPLASAAATAVTSLQGLSGAEFDQQWIAAVIAHHEEGKAMSADKKAAKEAKGDDESMASKSPGKKQMHQQMKALEAEQQSQLERLQALQARLAP